MAAASPVPRASAELCITLSERLFPWGLHGSSEWKGARRVQEGSARREWVCMEVGRSLT